MYYVSLQKQRTDLCLHVNFFDHLKSVDGTRLQARTDVFLVFDTVKNTFGIVREKGRFWLYFLLSQVIAIT